MNAAFMLACARVAKQRANDERVAASNLGTKAIRLSTRDAFYKRVKAKGYDLSIKTPVLYGQDPETGLWIQG